MNTDINSAAIASSTSVGSALIPFQRFCTLENYSAFPPCPSTSTAIAASKHLQKPRKKRSRMIRLHSEQPVAASSSGSNVSKPKHGKKPDPAAPKITRPCSECGKKFWSWKALFGHMRCHPERQWRGINPPINFRRPISISSACPNLEAAMTEEDQDIADCLIMLANGPTAVDWSTPESDGGAGPSCRFECSSCKKVFGSHQALGGHRASHKNVKGCFAITRSDEEIPAHSIVRERNFNFNPDDEEMLMVLGTAHQCSICTRVFHSGQALGGHMRRHWERVEESTAATEGCCAIIDLNKPAPTEEDDESSSYSSGLTLDLRLGL